MKLTAKGRYAVMAIADMAAQGEGEVVSLSDISMRQGISLSYLEQLFAKIRKAGLVKSQRGAKGGYVLSEPAQTLTLDHIIQAVNEDIKAHGCTPEAKRACTGLADRCLTHNLWGALEKHIGSFLASITVLDVVEGRLPIPEAPSVGGSVAGSVVGHVTDSAFAAFAPQTSASQMSGLETPVLEATE